MNSSLREFSDYIEKFNYTAGLILEDRKSCFPLQDGFHPAKILGISGTPKRSASGHETAIYIFDDVETDFSSDFDYVKSTALWLIDHGYMSGTVSSGGALKFTLSPISLKLLSSMPTSLETTPDKPTFSSMLSSAIKEKTAEKISTIMSEYFSDGLFLLKSAAKSTISSALGQSS